MSIATLFPTLLQEIDVDNISRNLFVKNFIQSAQYEEIRNEPSEVNRRAKMLEIVQVNHAWLQLCEALKESDQVSLAAKIEKKLSEIIAERVAKLSQPKRWFHKAFAIRNFLPIVFVCITGLALHYYMQQDHQQIPNAHAGKMNNFETRSTKPLQPPSLPFMRFPEEVDVKYVIVDSDLPDEVSKLIARTCVDVYKRYRATQDYVAVAKDIITNTSNLEPYKQFPGVIQVCFVYPKASIMSTVVAGTSIRLFISTDGVVIHVFQQKIDYRIPLK